MTLTFFILLLSFILRILPRIILKDSWNYDTYFHMSMSRIIRKNNYIVPQRKEQISLPDRIVYPWLFHWILAFVPYKHLYLAEKISSATIDLIHIALAMLVTYNFTNDNNIYLWVGLYMALSPSFLRVGIGPRAYNATPRVLSQLLLMIFFSSLLFYYQEHNYIFFISATVSACLTLLSSKFGIQVLFLISISLIFFGYLIPIASVLFALLLSLLLFKDFIPKMLTAHFISMKYYFTTLIKNFHALREQKACVTCYIKRIKQNFLTTKMLNWFMMDQYPLHIIIFFMPQIWIIFLYQDNISANFDFIYWTIISSLIIFLLILIPKLSFIGEAERYLEHTVLFQLILFIVMFKDNNILLYSMLLWYILCYTQYLRLYIRYSKKANNIPKQLAPLLETIDVKSNILYPLGSYNWILLFYLKNAKSCYPSTAWNTVIPKKDLEELVGNYPYPGVSLQELMKKFGITHIVTDEISYKNYQNKVLNYKDDNLELLAKMGIFQIYKVKPNAN